VYRRAVLGGDSHWLAMTQSAAKDGVSLALFLFMCSGGFFVARGVIRVGKSLLSGVVPSGHPVGMLRRDGCRDLIVATVIIGGVGVVALVTFTLW
jgi:hypothetical protein